MKLDKIMDDVRWYIKVYDYFVERKGYTGAHPLSPEFQQQSIYELPLGRGVMTGSL